MGFAPRQVDAMSLWTFDACLAGWNRAHGGKPAAPSDEEFDAAVAAIGE